MPLPRIFAKVIATVRHRKPAADKPEAQPEESAPRFSAFSFEQAEQLSISNINEHDHAAEGIAAGNNDAAETQNSRHDSIIVSSNTQSVEADDQVEQAERVISSIRSPLHFPTFAGASSEETLGWYSNIDRTSKDLTTLQHPPVIEKILQGCVQSHHAIKDVPPPFVRHSAPDRHQHGAKKQVELVEQERRQLQDSCSLIDAERERLSTRLEQVCEELALSQDHLERAVGELVVRESECAKMKDERACMEHQRKTALDVFARQHLELQALKEKHADFRIQHYRQVRALIKYRSEKKQDVMLRACELDADLIRANGQVRRLEMTLARRETQYQHEQQQNVVVNGLGQVEAKLATAEEELRAAQRQLAAVQEERDAETKELELAQREVYEMTQQLRVATRTLNDRASKLEESKRNNKDLVLEIRYLKQQVAAAQGHRLTV